MDNIDVYDCFTSAKKKKDVELKLAEINKQNEITALKNGYETYMDYEYAMYKIYSKDPRFSLSKEYYKKCQKYLLNALKAYINYYRCGSLYNKSFVLTIYSLNELTSALLNNNKLLISELEKYNINSIDLLESMSEGFVDIKKLKLR